MWHHAMVRMNRLLALIALVVVGVWLHRVTTPQPQVETPPRATTPRPEPPAPAPKREAAKAEGKAEDRHDLAADEARGGHTLARHVGRSDADLRERLASEGISTASTYTSREVAERTVARALRDNADRVDTWTERRGTRPNLAIDYRGSRGEAIGRCMRRGRESVDCFDAVVVLRWSGRDYFVLTSYPEPSR